MIPNNRVITGELLQGGEDIIENRGNMAYILYIDIQGVKKVMQH